MDLQGRSILLTGGGSGTGRSLALELSDRQTAARSGRVSASPASLNRYGPAGARPMWCRPTSPQGAHKSYRRLLGPWILLWLEFLVAADIIRTVALTPTFRSVRVLAVIVVIRTFLSFSLELEITGRWP